MNVRDEIKRASEFGRELEDLVVARQRCPWNGDRDRVLVGCWALIFDYHKGILSLVANQFYGSAFALVRPLVEALIRAHVALMGSEEDVRKIKNDEYSVNFKTVGGEIDKAFGLGDFFENFLNGARGALHSFTHSGLSQLGRRFKGNDIIANYADEEIIEVIHVISTAGRMVTNLVTKHFKFEAEAKAAEELFTEWGKH